MKKMIHWTRFAILTSVTALLLGMGGAAYAQNEGSAKGGGQKLMQAKILKTSKDHAGLKNGDIVVSTCAHCKTTSYKRIDTAKGGASALNESGKGGCPACGAKASSSGEMKHTCKMCKAETVCCVIPAKDDGDHKHE